MGSEIGWDGQDVVSPELVLVSSPEEARSARDRLPDMPWLAPPTSSATSASTLDIDAQAQNQRRPQPPRYPRVDEHSEPPPSHRRRSLVLAIPLGAALVAVGYLTEHGLHGRSTASPVPVPSIPVGSTALENVGKRAAPITSTKRAADQSSRPVAPASTPVGSTVRENVGKQATATPSTTRVADRGAQTSSSSSKAPAPGEFVPSRTWGWAPQPGAVAYDVIFYRNGRIVLHARSKNNDLVLPRWFQFEAGRYRWTVRPVPTVQGEPPIADSAFSLTPAAAAAANKQ